VALSDDYEIAVAVLAQDHKLIPVTDAWRLIKGARDGHLNIIDGIREEVAEDDLLRAIAKEMGIVYYDLYSVDQHFREDREVLDKMELTVLKRYCALPLKDRKTGGVVVATSLPDMELQDHLKRVYGRFSFVLTPAYQIQDRLAILGADTAAEALAAQTPTVTSAIPRPVIAPPAQLGRRNQVVELIDNMLDRAVAVSASDIHLTMTAEGRLEIRFRIDGDRRRQMLAIPPGRDLEVLNALVGRCDTIDAANFREPQDGTFTFTAAGRQIDARLAMLPQLNGPAVVVRLLDSRNLQTRLDDMGFSPHELQTMRRASTQSQGTILVTGPTGSGKSTTVYGLLREVDHESKNVMTVEDPVEYRLPGIGQTPIRHDLGERSVTFIRALRSILRMDPDIILVGEIRDAETARVTMDFSITGHLVFSTIHAPSAIGVYIRLVEMGIQPYLPAEAISLIVSQRLVRKVHECGRQERPSREEMAWYSSMKIDPPEKVSHPVGCAGCSNTGYRGRIALVEVLTPGPALREAILRGGSQAELLKVAKSEGFRPIVLNGVEKIETHQTTVLEVARVLTQDSGEAA
jgi:type II secretory ATPase GspE/PulE/Tfp pilus assembly ATPase PilB-like protein